MKKRLGSALQAAGGAILFLAAGASDTGAVSAGGLAFSILCAALLFFTGRALRRREKACILPPHGAGAACRRGTVRGTGKGRRKHVLSAPLCFFLSVCPSAAES